MADINLQPDERALHALMPDDGATIGNGKARESLGWEEERYTTAKEGLIAKGAGGRWQRARR
ncbi:MAG: hypothetical protein IPN38_15070 [Flavobacteriales bacterium]|nr:hypothetical protein [Flavobacteriales bacterium]